jgi:hypothetical protein
MVTALPVLNSRGCESAIMLEFCLFGRALRKTSNIMKSESFHAEDLVNVLRRNKIATMPELKKALGTEVDVTVFRKLKQLSYRTSYSHRGSYYTLDEAAQFDEKGLWSFNSVWFSAEGTLLATAEALVENSEAGYFVEELDAVLHVGTKEPLLRLVQQKRIAREPVSGLYLYCSIQAALRRRQLVARRVCQNEPTLASSVAGSDAVDDELKASMVLFLSTLNEKQRRLYAGLESLKLGYGGDQRIADFVGLDAHTVAKGRRELEQHDLDVERIRRAGGGRKKAEKKRRKSSLESKS